MKPYSSDLRERIVAACDEGKTEKQVAEQFSISQDTVQRYKRHLRERGTLVPKPIPGRPRIIKEAEEKEFLILVASQSNWTLATLGEAWEQSKGVKPTVSVLSDTCRRLGITRKKRVG